MAYQQNNSKERESVNTRGVVFKNKDGYDPSALTIAYWDGLMSLKFNPALEPSKQTETAVYDYEKTISTAFNVEKIAFLLKRIKTVIIPAIEANEDKSIGMNVGGNSLISIGTGKSLTGEIRPFIALHKSLDPTTKKAEMGILYEFRRNQSIDDYNPKTGEYSLVEGVHSELDAFITILQASIFALTNAFSHADRFVNKYFNDKQWNLLNDMAEKIGCPSQRNTGNKGYNSKPSIDFGASSNNTNSKGVTSDVVDETLDGLDDMADFMN